MRAVGGHDESADRRRRAAAEFRRRIAAGHYRGLFDQRLAQIMAQAAAERSLADEIGALRVTIARLLLEESDPTKLAAGIPRLVTASVRAARAQQAISGQVRDTLNEYMQQVLIEQNLGRK